MNKFTYSDYDNSFREYLSETEDPLISDFRAYTKSKGLPSANSFMRHLQADSWRELLLKYGILHEFSIDYSKEEMISIFKEEYDRIRPRTRKEFDEKAERFKAASFCKVTGLHYLQLVNLVTGSVRYMPKSKEELKELYLSIYQKYGRQPTVAELSENGFHLTKKYWTSHNDFIRFCGLEPESIDKENVTESNDELIAMYKAFSHKIGEDKHGASWSQLNKSDEIYNWDIFCQRFNGLTQLKELCGYTPYRSASRKYTQEELQDKLIDYVVKLGRIPTNREIEMNKELPTTRTITRYFCTTKITDVYRNLYEITCNEQFKRLYEEKYNV